MRTGGQGSFALSHILRSFPRKRESRAAGSVCEALGPRFPPSRYALRRTPSAPKLAKRAEAGRGDERRLRCVHGGASAFKVVA